MLLTTGIMFADFASPQWNGPLSLHNGTSRWHNDTLLLTAESIIVISQKKPINKTMT
jgi:hypothetical protein